ncbi:hypothetical protein [uncultured Bacteroides sp.]|uniref:hypothetical protein n=1 Tax=uncultured Bacteroides sp. TaxID=162156 RepID=UPI002AAA9CFC|nr:hypothetical protein [uncultured Bacteroides sp.]
MSNNYVKVSVPRPEGNAGRGIAPKDALTLIDVDDIEIFPSRDGAGVVLAGDIVLKAGAYATTLYVTPGTVELTSNGEGDADAKGFTPTVKGKHPGKKQAIREFKTNWLGRHCIAILNYANGDPADLAGSPTNPLDMGIAYTGNKDSNSSEFTFTQISKGEDIAIYPGTIPYEEPLSTVATAATAVPYVGDGQYQLTGGAASILSITGATHGAIITLLGVESGVAPTIATEGSMFILKDGKTFTASPRSQITFKTFKDSATTFKFIEQSRYEA